MQKKCGRCGKAGHRRNKCPLNEEGPKQAGGLDDGAAGLDDEAGILNADDGNLDTLQQEESLLEDLQIQTFRSRAFVKENHKENVQKPKPEPEPEPEPPQSKVWKGRGRSATGSRLSSALPSAEEVLQNLQSPHPPEGELQPHLYPRFLTRTLSGIEKKCLLLRGAKEKSPDVADADLVPLDGQEEFARHSSLSSFWKALSRKPDKVPKDEFYFIRIEGPAQDQTCTGLVLLQHIAYPTTSKPFMEFDIKGFCSTGKGKETLLLLKLNSYLRSIHPWSRLLVRQSRFPAATINFCLQMGFEKMAEVDALSADLRSNMSREMAQNRVGGVVEVLDETEAIAVQTDDGLVESFWPPVDAEVAMFGEAARYFGQRYTVRGNGTCWLYSILAALGVLEHANAKPLRGSQEELTPTPKDYKLSQVFLEKMRAEVRLMRIDPR